MVVQAYWQVYMGGIVSNGKTILSDISSIIDTGTSLVVGKASEVARLHEALGGSNASDTYGRGYWSCTYVTRVH
jgi:cathepsin D